MSSFEKRTTEVEYIGIDGGTLRTYVDSDRLAEERADNVAFYGLWEKHAHSGFEDTVRQIA